MPGVRRLRQWGLIAFVAGIAGSAIGAANSVSAQVFCGDRALIVNSLAVKFAEKPVSVGLAKSGGIIEVFASSSGTWTILLSMPDGRSCYLASGEGWENFPILVDGRKT